jgi:hypothetical protein
MFRLLLDRWSSLITPAYWKAIHEGLPVWQKKETQRLALDINAY